MAHRIITIRDRERWDNFISSHPEANFLQSYSYGEFHERLGWPVVRRAVVDEIGNIIAAYTGYREPARRGAHLAIPGGPIADYTDHKLIQVLIDDIASEARRHNCVFVRLRPQEPASAATNKLLRKLGLHVAPMYLSVERASVLDLNLTEDEILANMRQQTRYGIRKTSKLDITIEATSDPEAIKEFYEIELTTAKRQKFIPFSYQFLSEQFRAFAENNEALLFIARLDGQVLAENFMIFYGNEASYHYAVSTEAGTRVSGAPLLHMAAMREARLRGITRYNLWGIVGLSDKKHRFYGVSTFKRGFGGQELLYTPAHDLVIKKWRYYCINWPIETLRARLRRVK
jgi:lipid II:glycine glycyltransferase (peptidoglycan interpeptide bridge formation enzyme)